ncbi:MAG TPA: pyridoxal-phosphate dependent enzyme [Firmicutes bacterium]|nr:pyridoxal-phosphate dependent enzyme [Bacillota bacterium]
MVSLEDVEQAREVLSGVVRRTPLVPAEPGPGFPYKGVYLKLESLQVTGSFKIRGAYVKVRDVALSGKARGVVAFSAGNHGKGVAYAAALNGLESAIVMPEYAVRAKVEGVRYLGGEPVISGSNSMETARKAQEIARDRGYVFVHPFNDPLVIAGQGTVGLEILEDLPDATQVVVPVSGGGLLSGVALAIKAKRPSVRLVGVQPEGSNAMYRSLKEGRVVELESVDTIADGLTAKRVERLTLDIVREYVDEIVLVSDEEIRLAARMMLTDLKVVSELSGAVGIAALISGKVSPSSGTVVVVSGSNVGGDQLLDLLRAG